MKNGESSRFRGLLLVFLALVLVELGLFAADRFSAPKPGDFRVLVLEAEEKMSFAGRYYLIHGTDPETQQSSYRFPYRSRVEPQVGEVIETQLQGGPLFNSWAGMIASILFWPLLLLGLSVGLTALIGCSRRRLAARKPEKR